MTAAGFRDKRSPREVIPAGLLSFLRLFELLVFGAVLRTERVLDNIHLLTVGDEFILDRRVQSLAERLGLIAAEEAVSEREVSLACAAVLGELPDIRGLQRS